MKCLEHGCEMKVVSLEVGWGDEVERECPECKKENENFFCGSSSRVYFPAEKEG